MSSHPPTIVSRVSDLIGRTPLLRLEGLAPEGTELLAKLEFFNPGGSIKDRPVRSMLDGAEARGELQPGATLIEASSGNTGISLAMLCAERGYRCVVVMPDDMSVERRKLMQAFGAKVFLTAAKDGVGGSMRRARQLADELRGRGETVFLTRQFDNPDNPLAHEETTAREILEQTGGKLHAFVAGVGTGGTITGTGRALKAAVQGVTVYGVEPARAQAFRGLPYEPHAIQGIGAGFVPTIVDHDVLDRVLAVTDEDALAMAQRLGHEFGLLVGPSSGANVVAAAQIAAELGAGARVVTFLCDTGERYLSA
jgi:cysteine synthase A